MPIPITTIGTKASEYAFLLHFEFAKTEIERLNTLILGDENSSGRNEATHVGISSIS